MGFTVFYRSTETVSASLRADVNAATDRLCEGMTWLSCEPVWFFMSGEQDGYLEGGSKPNFTPHPDDVGAAQQEGLPDGTIRSVVEVLCELSSEFGIDWEFGHDHDPGPVGSIRAGKADAELWNLIDELVFLSDAIEQEFEAVASPQLFTNQPPRQVTDDIDSAEDNNDDGDDAPHILKFRPRD